MILQFLALRNPLPKIFLNEICSKWHFIVCANTLLLLEHFLKPWVFIWNHSSVQVLHPRNLRKTSERFTRDLYSEISCCAWPVPRIFSNLLDAKPEHQYVVLFVELSYYERTLKGNIKKAKIRKQYAKKQQSYVLGNFWYMVSRQSSDKNRSGLYISKNILIISWI